MTDVPDANPAELARDWATIWHSELSATATDRERAETWSNLLAAWASWNAACLAALPVRPDGPAGSAARPPPARPAAADAAPDARDAANERLARRVEDLERRLDELGAAARQ